MIYDTFLFNDELDMLECRLTEFDRYTDEPVTHVVVEATVTHRDEPKPLYYQENKARFEKWSNRIQTVTMGVLPTKEEDPDPWSREHAQREYTWLGISHAQPNDVILHGDVDEIPRMANLKMVCDHIRVNHTPAVFEMKMHCYAVDWYSASYPWRGTVGIRRGDIGSLRFTALRDLRNVAFPFRDAGWHLTWFGGNEAIQRKLKSHCHLEMTAEEEYWPASGRSYREGRTHGGIIQVPVDDLSDYPVYVRERLCPASWFRPREETTT